MARRNYKCLLLAIVTLYPATSNAEIRTIRVVAIDVKTKEMIPISVHRKELDKGETVAGSTSIAEEVQFDEDSCSVRVSYLARPKAAALYDGVEWQSCRSGKDVYEFAFTPILDPSELTAKFTYGVMNGWPLGAEPVAYEEGVRVFEKLYDEGDYGGAAFIATELSEALRRKGDVVGANSFNSVAIATGLQAVTYDVDSSLSPLLVISDGLVLPTEAGKSAIGSYQMANGLEITEKLDWNTLKSTSPLASSDIVELGMIRIEALSAVQ